jgi:ABC-type sugar transport system ATPase subunit
MLISTHEAVRSGIMLLPGDRKHEALMPVLGVRVNATIQSLRRFGTLGFLRRRKERRTVQDLIARLEIRTPSVEQPVEFLSGGNQQKVRFPAVLLGAGRDLGVRADAGRRRRVPLRHLRRASVAERRRHRVARQVERHA